MHHEYMLSKKDPSHFKPPM
jgi:hypothetical protein